MPKDTSERDGKILDLWNDGATARAIGDGVGLSHVRVARIVAEARAAGDPRARLHGRRASDETVERSREALRVAGKVKQRNILAQRFPSTPEERALLIATSTIPITRLRPGPHLGWRPSWLA